MAYSNVGFATEDIGSGVSLTVAITGASATSISVVNNATDTDLVCSLDLNPDRDDDGVPMTIRPATILTITPGDIYGFTIAYISGTGTQTVDVYWW